MKIGIVSPYFETTGGGERYMLTLASSLSGNNDVSVFWDNAERIIALGKDFHIDLSKTKVVQNIFRKQNLLGKLNETRKYDLIVFLSDGSVPWSLARFNILHFQVPFTKLPFEPLRMSRFQATVVNSEFTKSHLDPRYAGKAVVIYPPVPVESYSATGKKSGTILHVGRFSRHVNAKKQEVLISAFRSFIKSEKHKTWSMVIAGSALREDMAYVEELKEKAKDLPVTILTNIRYGKLKNLYEGSRIYWHAAGYGETDPARFEHFGISTVEAMSAGCVPLVFAGGGLSEIVTDGRDGFLWKTPRELVEKTTELIADAELLDRLSGAAVARAGDFDTGKFTEKFVALIGKITQ